MNNTDMIVDQPHANPIHHPVGVRPLCPQHWDPVNQEISLYSVHNMTHNTSYNMSYAKFNSYRNILAQRNICDAICIQTKNKILNMASKAVQRDYLNKKQTEPVIRLKRIIYKKVSCEIKANSNGMAENEINYAINRAYYLI